MSDGAEKPKMMDLRPTWWRRTLVMTWVPVAAVLVFIAAFKGARSELKSALWELCDVWAGRPNRIDHDTLAAISSGILIAASLVMLLVPTALLVLGWPRR